MKWTLFTGSRAPVNLEVESDVRAAVREVIAKDGGVLTGGAAGVDYFAMSEVAALNSLDKLRILLPTKLEIFIEHYKEAERNGKIDKKVCDDLLQLLQQIYNKSPISFLEMSFKQITLQEYFARDEEEVKYSDYVYAFQVNDSVGTGHTVKKAQEAGLPILVHKKYII